MTEIVLNNLTMPFSGSVCYSRGRSACGSMTSLSNKGMTSVAASNSVYQHRNMTISVSSYNMLDNGCLAIQEINAWGGFAGITPCWEPLDKLC